MTAMETPETIPQKIPPYELRGVLIIGADGKKITANGIALEPELGSRIEAQWREARRRNRLMFNVEGVDGRHVVIVVLPTADCTVFVAMEQEGRNTLFEFVGAVDFSGEIMTHFLTNPFAALSVVDREGLVRYMSPVHENFFGLKPGGGIGRPSEEVIENSRLQNVLNTGKAEIGLLHEMRNVTRIVSRHPIRNTKGELVGAIGQIMFKGPEQLQTMSTELLKLKSEVAYYRRELSDLKNRSYGLDQILGDSLAMQRLKQQIVKVAPLDVPVLITGESGTGKELAAHAIHKLSSRRDENLVIVNAAALPSTLVESELFGYEAGAFTGAERKGRKGKIEQADCGSLFLDEVGDMPADVQIKLLRVLQDGSFQRVGSNELRHSNFRLISASNRNFETMIADGSFRLDLFYRIGGVTIRMPSLRDRMSDIPQLAEFALNQFAQRHRQPPKRLSDEAGLFLQRQRWPGNIRQLIHTIERAAIFGESDVIAPADFGLVDSEPQNLPFSDAVQPTLSFAQSVSRESMHVSNVVDKVEEELIRKAMAMYSGNKKRVAAELGISRSYLYKRLAQIGLHIES